MSPTPPRASMATASEAPLAPRQPEATDTELEAPASGRGAVLSEGTLTGADLSGLELAEGRWSDLRLRSCSLANAAIRRTEVRRAVLEGCRATGCSLAESTLTDVAFDDCRIDLASFRFATLERVVFRDCRLEEADFYEARLRSVLFERCRLVDATLAGVTLSRVELRGCELDGVRGAESLRGARMPWPDVVAGAGAFAAALGIVVVD